MCVGPPSLIAAAVRGVGTTGSSLRCAAVSIIDAYGSAATCCDAKGVRATLPS